MTIENPDAVDIKCYKITLMHYAPIFENFNFDLLFVIKIQIRDERLGRKMRNSFKNCRAGP